MSATKRFLAILLSIVVLASCKDKQAATPTPVPADTSRAQGTLYLYHGDSLAPLPFQQTVTTSRGDKITLKKVRYYLSNPALIDSSGRRVALGAWYHLVSVANPASFEVALPPIRPGRYQSLELMLGIDSTHNVSGAQAGDLAPDSGMFWTWASGYIHTMLEGDLARSSTGSFAWHVGGYGRPTANQRILSFPLNDGQMLAVAPKGHLHVRVQANILAALTGSLSLKNSPYVTEPHQGAAVADQWLRVFRTDSVWTTP